MANGNSRFTMFTHKSVRQQTLYFLFYSEVILKTVYYAEY